MVEVLEDALEADEEFVVPTAVVVVVGALDEVVEVVVDVVGSVVVVVELVLGVVDVAFFDLAVNSFNCATTLISELTSFWSWPRLNAFSSAWIFSDSVYSSATSA